MIKFWRGISQRWEVEIRLCRIAEEKSGLHLSPLKEQSSFWICCHRYIQLTKKILFIHVIFLAKLLFLKCMLLPMGYQKKYAFTTGLLALKPVDIILGKIFKDHWCCLHNWDYHLLRTSTYIYVYNMFVCSIQDKWISKLTFLRDRKSHIKKHKNSVEDREMYVKQKKTFFWLRREIMKLKV